MQQYDVVVIGAGLAGLRTSRLLAQAGLSVLLADRKQRVDVGVQTTGIFVRRTLQMFRPSPECLGPAVSRVTLYSPAGRPLPLESPRPEFRIGRMPHLYAEQLDHALEAGVAWAPGHTFERIDCLHKDTLVELRDSDGRASIVRARFVVGADGVFSKVAGSLHLDTNKEWIVAVEVVLSDVAVLGRPQLHCFLDPVLAPGYIGWVAHDGEQTHVGVGGYADRFKPAEALAAFRRRAGEVLVCAGIVSDPSALVRASVVDRRGGSIPVGGILERLAGRRGLLVGDAAGAASPLTAGGLDPCIRLSSIAADAISRHLGDGDPTALTDYRGATFRPAFAGRMRMRRTLGAVGSPWQLELAWRALRLPPLRALAEHVFFGPGSFPDLGPTAHRAPGGLTRSAV